MSVVLVSCHDFKYAPLAEITLYGNKKIYCKKHDYILFESTDLGASWADGRPMSCTLPLPKTHIPGGWGKIYAMKAAMEKYPQSEWIFNIDADAMITNMTIKIEDIVGKVGADDPKIHIVVPGDINGINCGVMIVRNSAIGKAFLDTVIAGMPLYRDCNMFENQLIQDLFCGTHLQLGGCPHQGGTFWHTVGKVAPQRVMNSYDYKNHPELKTRYSYNDVLNTDGQWQQGDFVVQWPNMPLDLRISEAVRFKDLCIM